METYRNDGGGSPIVSACGPVETDESREYWVGAKRSTNNTAEMQAMIGALYWLNSCIEGKLYSLSTKVLITVDSLYVKGLSDEKFMARENKAIAMLLCHMWKVVRGNVSLVIRWVRRHTGDVENTIADELAEMGTRLEEMNRWWKRIQPMGNLDEFTFRKKLENRSWCLYFQCLKESLRESRSVRGPVSLSLSLLQSSRLERYKRRALLSRLANVGIWRRGVAVAVCWLRIHHTGEMSADQNLEGNVDYDDDDEW